MNDAIRNIANPLFQKIKDNILLFVCCFDGYLFNGKRMDMFIAQNHENKKKKILNLKHDGPSPIEDVKEYQKRAINTYHFQYAYITKYNFNNAKN